MLPIVHTSYHPSVHSPTWVGGWMDGYVGGWMDGWMSGWLEGRVDVWKKWMERMDGCYVHGPTENKEESDRWRKWWMWIREGRGTSKSQQDIRTETVGKGV